MAAAYLYRQLSETQISLNIRQSRVGPDPTYVEPQARFESSLLIICARYRLQDGIAYVLLCAVHGYMEVSNCWQGVKRYMVAS